MPSLEDYDEQIIYRPAPTNEAGLALPVFNKIMEVFKKNITLPKFKKWIDVMLDVINNIIDSLSNALQGVGEALKEIKHFFESGKKISDTRISKPRESSH